MVHLSSAGRGVANNLRMLLARATLPTGLVSIFLGYQLQPTLNLIVLEALVNLPSEIPVVPLTLAMHALVRLIQHDVAGKVLNFRITHIFGHFFLELLNR